MTHDSDRREAALDWLVRTNDPEFDRWDEFTAWLEQSPGNADAYHSLAGAEAEMLPLVEAAPDAGETPKRRPVRRGMALAASVAALAALTTAVIAPRMMPVDYSTGSGEIRVIALGGQDELVMNGETRLQLSGWDRRTVRLEQGQVLLRLHAPDGDKIEVISGDLELVDVGTVFEVSRDGRQTRVLVSEGAVVADPGGARLQLAAGQRLDTVDGAALLQAMPADIASVGSFERGQLSYLDEPLQNVIADLSRSTGIDFSASAAISSRRFTGTLSVAEVKRDPRSLGPLLGVPIERSGQGWRLGGKV
ncbi:MAG TPA: FecR domain-containing protein [Sphingomicrobium sp.]|jgi:transmembrane sensor|nr:FecR domain-containing protein [Sphingomicrobium sp.]